MDHVWPFGYLCPAPVDFFYFEGNFKNIIMCACAHIPSQLSWFGPPQQSPFLRWPFGNINCPPWFRSFPLTEYEDQKWQIRAEHSLFHTENICLVAKTRQRWVFFCIISQIMKEKRSIGENGPFRNFGIWSSCFYGCRHQKDGKAFWNQMYGPHKEVCGLMLWNLVSIPELYTWIVAEMMLEDCRQRVCSVCCKCMFMVSPSLFSISISPGSTMHWPHHDR